MSAPTTSPNLLHAYLRADLKVIGEILDKIETEVAQMRARLSTLTMVADDLQTLEEMALAAVPVIEAVAADLVAPCLDRMPGGGLAAPQCQFTRDHEGRHVNLRLDNAGMETRTEWHGSYLQVTRTEVK